MLDGPETDMVQSMSAGVKSLGSLAHESGQEADQKEAKRVLDGLQTSMVQSMSAGVKSLGSLAHESGQEADRKEA